MKLGPSIFITSQSTHNGWLQREVKLHIRWTCTYGTKSESTNRVAIRGPHVGDVGAEGGDIRPQSLQKWIIFDPCFSFFSYFLSLFSQTIFIYLPFWPPSNPDTTLKTTVTPKFSVELQLQPPNLTSVFIQMMNTNPKITIVPNPV